MLSITIGNFEERKCSTLAYSRSCYSADPKISNCIAEDMKSSPYFVFHPPELTKTGNVQLTTLAVNLSESLMIWIHFKKRSLTGRFGGVLPPPVLTGPLCFHVVANPFYFPLNTKAQIWSSVLFISETFLLHLSGTDSQQLTECLVVAPSCWFPHLKAFHVVWCSRYHQENDRRCMTGSPSSHSGNLLNHPAFVHEPQ